MEAIENPLNDTSDPTTLYLNDIGRNHRLLTAEEEIQLGRQVQKGCRESREKMIIHNLRLVVNQAKRYKSSGLPLLDLVNEGNIGLMHAVEKFDPERGFRFSTYATWWIRQAIERGLMNTVRMIRLPVHVGRELNSVKRAFRELSNDGLSEVTVEQVAEHLERTVDEINFILGNDFGIASMDKDFDGEDSGNKLSLFLEDNRYQPTAGVEQDLTKQVAEKMLSVLSDREREIVCRRYGLFSYPPHTLEEVAKIMGITRERVRQIQLQSTEQMKRHAKRYQTGDIFGSLS